MSSAKAFAVPIVYIRGDDMTRYVGDLILNQLFLPWLDLSKWQIIDMSCANRLISGDVVMKQCIESCLAFRSAFKEPTVTPTAEQIQSLLAEPGVTYRTSPSASSSSSSSSSSSEEEAAVAPLLESPNIILRTALGGFSVSRDTLHVPGVSLGYQHQVFFDRYAIGGLYSAGHSLVVGAGTVETAFFPDHEDRQTPAFIPLHKVRVESNASTIVTFHNPLGMVPALAHHFFQRCLKARIIPYVVTKRSVFRWQESFWTTFLKVYNECYRSLFVQHGVVSERAADLRHLLTDSAAVQLVRWKKGGFGMCSGNYDGDVLTDELAEVHGNPGFLTSVVVGDHPATGERIQLFEAVHGTAPDMWRAHLAGQQTSFNPAGMLEGILRAVEFRASLEDPSDSSTIESLRFVRNLRESFHQQLASHGTRDIQRDGLTTEKFIRAVALQLAARQQDKQVFRARI